MSRFHKELVKKCVFSKLVLACMDEIFNTSNTSVVDKKATYEKNNCLIYAIWFDNYVLININCHFY